MAFTATKDLILPATVTGSWPRPRWFDDSMWGRPLDTCMMDVRFREKFQDALATVLSDQERAGLDIITDGEMRRESYSNRFATALEGVDIDNPGTALDRSGHPNPVPRITGKVRRKHPVEVKDVAFLRANTIRPIKITVPGPFTMSQQAQNDFYKSEEEAAADYADAVNAEIKDLFAAGADVVQIDEPYMQARPEPARRYGLRALNRAHDLQAKSILIEVGGDDGTDAVGGAFQRFVVDQDRGSVAAEHDVARGLRRREHGAEPAYIARFDPPLIVPVGQVSRPQRSQWRNTSPSSFWAR